MNWHQHLKAQLEKDIKFLEELEEEWRCELDNPSRRRKLENSITILKQQISTREADLKYLAVDKISEPGLREEQNNSLDISASMQQARSPQISSKNLEQVNSAIFNSPQNPKEFKAQKSELSEYEVSLTQLNSIPFNIPPDIGISPERFKGREQDIKTLHYLLQRSNRVAITGMRGVGKTELAVQYARKHKELGSYPGGFCWLKAGEPNLARQILYFAKLHLNPPVLVDLGDVTLAPKDKVVRLWQNWRPPGAVLVLLDDVTDVKQLASCLQLLPPPEVTQFRVLVTTQPRQPDPNFSELPLRELKPLVAMQLLKSLIHRKRLQREPWVARKICKWLGCLPLGLELVGRYLLDEPHLTLTKMWERLQAESLKHEALDLDEQQIQEDYPTMTAKRGVRAAFELTWKKLDVNTTKNVVLLLSLFAPADIPWRLVEWTTQLLNWREHKVNKARKELLKYHLIQYVDTAAVLYQIHSLLREFFKEKFTAINLDDAEYLKQVFVAAVAKEAELIPQDPTCESIMAIKPFIPHIEEVATNLTNFLSEKDITSPFFGLSRFYESQGFSNQAKLFSEKCCYVTRESFGPEHPKVVESLINLSEHYRKHCSYQEAKRLLELALEISRRLTNSYQLLLATCLSNLGVVLQSLDDQSQAELRFVEALELDKKLLAVNSFERFNAKELSAISRNAITTLMNLAALYQEKGNYNEAQFQYDEVAKLIEQLQLGKVPFEDSILAIFLNNITNLYKEQGFYNEAISNFEEHLQHTRCLFGNHHLVATISYQLADSYENKSDYINAEFYYQQALKLTKYLKGKDHKEVGVILNDLGLFYHNWNRKKDAEFCYRQALEIFTSQLGANDRETINTFLNLQHLLADL